MDYTDPANRRLRDEPTLPLSPEEAVIAAQLCQQNVLKHLLNLLPLTGKTDIFQHEQGKKDHTN